MTPIHHKTLTTELQYPKALQYHPLKPPPILLQLPLPPPIQLLHHLPLHLLPQLKHKQLHLLHPLLIRIEIHLQLLPRHIFEYIHILLTYLRSIRLKPTQTFAQIYICRSIKEIKS